MPIVYGVNAVSEALKAVRTKESLLTKYPDVFTCQCKRKSTILIEMLFHQILPFFVCPAL